MEKIVEKMFSSKLISELNIAKKAVKIASKISMNVQVL